MEHQDNKQQQQKPTLKGPIDTIENLRELATIFRSYIKLQAVGDKDYILALEAIKTQIEADRDVCNLFLEQLNTKLGSLFSDSDEDSSSDLSDYSDDPPIIWHQEEKEEEDKEEEDKEEEEKEDKEEDENEKTIKPPNSQLEIIDCPFSNLEEDLDELYEPIFEIWRNLNECFQAFELINNKPIDSVVQKSVNSKPESVDELFVNFLLAASTFKLLYFDEVYKDLYKGTEPIRELFQKFADIQQEIPPPPCPKEEEKKAEEEEEEEDKNDVKRKNRHTPFQNYRAQLENFKKGTYFKIWRKWNLIIHLLETKILKETKLAMSHHIVHDIYEPMVEYVDSFVKFKRNANKAANEFAKTRQQLCYDYPDIRKYIRRVESNFYMLQDILDDIRI